MRLSDLAGARVALLGLGRDVTAALPAVVSAGPATLVVVDYSLQLGGLVEVGGGLDPAPVVSFAEAASAAEVFVRSPGFPRYSPELASAEARGARITTPLDLWLGGLDPERQVVAVTGTKGKSTTASMIVAGMASLGLEAVLAGNIGIPVFEEGWDDGVGVVVLEVSSYQAADLHHPPSVAVVTSLAEDHVDWHGDAQRYVADKMRVLANEGGVAGVAFALAGSEGVESAVRSAAMEAACKLRLVDLPTWDGPAVPEHTMGNAALAAAVVGHLCGRPVEVVDVLAVSPELESRLEVLGTAGGLVWVDDALGSNPSATAAGLAWLRSLDRPVVVLLGGAERGVDPRPLVAEVGRWAAGKLQAVALPENGAALARAVGIEALAEVSDVAEAVVVAAAKAPPGGVVLFSPAAPTPRSQGTWRERSAQLREAVERLPAEGSGPVAGGGDVRSFVTGAGGPPGRGLGRKREER